MRKPLAHRVIVKLTTPEDLKAADYIEIPQQHKDMIMYSHTEGVIVAIGPTAFKEAAIFGTDEEFLPKIGDTVAIVKNSGIQYKEETVGLSVVTTKSKGLVEERHDKYDYFRVINDLDIYAKK